MTTLKSFDPRTGTANGAAVPTPLHEVDDALAAADGIADELAQLPPAVRGGWLRSIATALERDEGLLELADAETAKGTERLQAELVRTVEQLRFYADVAEEGSWLRATLDHLPTGVPLCSVRQPLGPVAVFGASNFPFAYGVLGNDTGSAVAAGCPVAVKAHPAHPLLSERLGALAGTALADAGAPEATFTLVAGFEAGQRLVTSPATAAVGFTGSQAGGMALWRLAAERPVVIPVYAEMGTVNPVLVTPSGGPRFAELTPELVNAFTLGMGQYCTKPGLVLAPRGSGAADAIARAVTIAAPRGWLLTSAIADAFHSGLRELQQAGASVVATVPGPDGGWSAPTTVLSVEAPALRREPRLLEECFGPVLLVAEYDDLEHLHTLLDELPGALAASVITAGPGDPDVSRLVHRIADTVGRVVVDGWTPGVGLTWGQQHGGPWPATTVPSATSVGAAALDRFTRPVAYEGVPDDALPPPLRTDNPWRIPRRVGGTLQPDAASSTS
ncbi:aldehyde dehydrogenase family protein [Phytoactinopolyspora halotolerans]|uniref:Aldehyde dehydrogenase family protein n=1 Tax=Phytoactinopolyspora halotolerans TaxID=1981512 RepID=A0A6L9S420_9ACTN|nr:aldehyde dehydrogenase family protein [Phytoactinopolyspora halotolerans]NEE00195.1 aldehyde dehydrogenase family protein [Phytoactinopolyspora halotolerans]